MAFFHNQDTSAQLTDYSGHFCTTKSGIRDTSAQLNRSFGTLLHNWGSGNSRSRDTFTQLNQETALKKCFGIFIYRELDSLSP